MFHGMGLLFQTPVFLHESQMCAHRIVRHIEEAWLGCMGLLTTDVDILELATMKMLLV